MDKMKGFFNYTLQWLLIRTHWVFLLIYIVITIAFEWIGFNWFWFFFWFLLGIIITTLVKGWKKKQEEDEKTIDLEMYEEEATKESGEGVFTKITGKGRKVFMHIVDMPLWVKIHWLIVCGFLGMTFWYMLCGLDLLFSGRNDFAIIAFSIMVTISLLWLIIMISSSKKNMLGYIIFYIIFDLFTAFQFNFIHFYDNVSQTQSMERDMDACNYYLDHQRPIISRVTQRVDTEIITLESTKSNLDRVIGNKTNERESINRTIQTQAGPNNDMTDLQNDKKRKKREISSLEKRREQVENKLLTRNSLSEQLKRIWALEDSIGHYCVAYQNAPDTFGFIDLGLVKQYVFDLDENICYLKDSVTVWYDITFDTKNDTVVWALNRLKKSRGDRFEGISKLMNLFKQAFENDETQDRLPSSGVAQQLELEEYDFENRLLIQSISLSAVIDLLPLALGIFVASVRKRKED